MTLSRKMAVLDVDRQHIDMLPIPGDWRRKFIGGRGLSNYLMWRYAGRDGGGAGDIAVLGAGLLDGTLSLPRGALSIVRRSSRNGLVACDFHDGPFSSEMRRAGFDHLVFRGRAKRPCRVRIHDGAIRLENLGGRKGRAGAASDRTAGPVTDGVHFTHSVLDEKKIRGVVCRGELDLEVRYPEDLLDFEGRRLKQPLEGAAFPGPGPESFYAGAAAGRATEGALRTAVLQCIGWAGSIASAEDSSFFKVICEQLRLNTGMVFSENELREAAYRVIALERLFNIRQGAVSGAFPQSLFADYRRNGWTKKAVFKKEAVFERLKIGDLWPLFKNPAGTSDGSGESR